MPRHATGPVKSIDRGVTQSLHGAQKENPGGPGAVAHHIWVRHHDRRYAGIVSGC
jgi:hypothetical protein